MTTDPRDALETHGILYNGAAARGGYQGGTVHVDDECAALDPDHNDITDAAQLPLRARVCKRCDPDHDIDYSAGNTEYADMPAIEDHDEGVLGDD
jgi:hypothetical protein